MDRAATDTVDGVAGVAVPGLQAKCPLAFAASPVQLTPPAGQLVPDHQDARRVLAHGLVHRFEGGVIYDQPSQLRLVGFVFRPVG